MTHSQTQRQTQSRIAQSATVKGRICTTETMERFAIYAASTTWGGGNSKSITERRMGNGAVVPDAGKPSMNAPQSNPALTTVNDDQIETALDAMWPSNERYYDDAHGSAEAGMKAALAALSPQPQVDWEAKFKSEQRACNHWFNEANKSHNEACKIAEEFREYREKHQQLQVTEEEIAAVLKQADSEAPMGDGFYPYLARAIIARLTGSVK